MKITTDTVKKVATLANLPLNEDEEKMYADQLSKILDYIDQLDQVNTDGIPPTYNTTGLENVMSEDEVGISLTQEQSTSNAANSQDGLFVTKGVFNNE